MRGYHNNRPSPNGFSISALMDPFSLFADDRGATERRAMMTKRMRSRTQSPERNNEKGKRMIDFDCSDSQQTPVFDEDNFSGGSCNNQSRLNASESFVKKTKALIRPKNLFETPQVNEIRLIDQLKNLPACSNKRNIGALVLDQNFLF